MAWFVYISNFCQQIVALLIHYTRLKLKQLKKEAWDNHQEKDVLCNFYIAKTGIVYEGRGWGIKVSFIYNTAHLLAAIKLI